MFAVASTPISSNTCESNNPTIPFTNPTSKVQVLLHAYAVDLPLALGVSLTIRYGPDASKTTQHSPRKMFCKPLLQLFKPNIAFAIPKAILYASTSPVGSLRSNSSPEGTRQRRSTGNEVEEQEEDLQSDSASPQHPSRPPSTASTPNQQTLPLQRTQTSSRHTLFPPPLSRIPRRHQRPLPHASTVSDR